MADNLKEGDRVRIADRNVTADDTKSGLFHNHYRGLAGSVQKIYPSNEAAVEIDIACLPEAVLARHLEMQEKKKNDFLDGLSDDARSKLTPKERDFKLRFTVLVALKDIAAA